MTISCFSWLCALPGLTRQLFCSTWHCVESLLRLHLAERLAWVSTVASLVCPTVVLVVGWGPLFSSHGLSCSRDSPHMISLGGQPGLLYVVVGFQESKKMEATCLLRPSYRSHSITSALCCGPKQATGPAPGMTEDRHLLMWGMA